MHIQLPIHKSVRIVLINQENEILLMCADDPRTRSKDGCYHGIFWFTIGGEIEEGEDFMSAAIRELAEETGLQKDDVVFGPRIWVGEFDMILDGVMVRMNQEFIVAYTKKNSISLLNLTSDEKKIVKQVAWFSLQDIVESRDIIYPVVLSEYLPDILNKNYPKEPLWIDLGKKPIRPS